MSQDPIAELTKSLNALSQSDDPAADPVLPKRWMNDSEDPGSSIERFHEDWPKYQAYYDSIGVPCRRVVTDADGTARMQPQQWAMLQSAGFEETKDEVNTTFVTLTRKLSVDQREEPLPGQATWYQMSGDSPEEVGAIVVPKEKGYRDTRPRVPRPINVVTTDKPAADTDRYLARGNEFVQRNWTNGKWKPGDLIGKGGSDPETKAQSASYATPDNWDKITDRRSATSTGHVPHHERPASVCNGWGGYDKFSHWQSCGRQVTKDMVEKEDWSTDLMKPVEFVKEEGEVVDTVLPAVQEKDLPSRPQKPVTLYELLNAGDVRNLKAPTERTNERTAAWPGTLNDRK